MIDRKNAVNRFRLWLRTFLESVTIDQRYESVHYVRPSLEALEERTLLSACPVNPLPIFSLASPVPSFAAITSNVASMMNEWGQLIETAQQDVIGIWKAIGQGIAQEVSLIHQEWDQLLRINPSGSNSATAAAGQGYASGSGSGSNTMTTGHEGGTQPIGTAKPLDGGGSGDGSGSGSGSSSMTGSATIAGPIWLDNDGNGALDENEMDYAGATVYLYCSENGGQTWGTWAAMPTNGALQGNNYGISIPDGDLQDTLWQVRVTAPYCTATIPNPLSVLDSQGFSPVFGLAPGELKFIPGGLRSMTVTTTQDDPNGVEQQNTITLRDAIKTGNNGPPFIAVTFYSAQGTPLSGTITLKAALDPIEASYDVDGPGTSTLAVSGANSFGVFNVQATSTISGLTIEDGSNGNGGGVLNNGNLTLKTDVITDNQTTGNGGGIYNSGGTLTLNGDQIINNTAGTSGGGLYNAGGTVSVTGTLINNNDAQYSGGGVFNSGTMTLTNARVANNDPNDGGGIFNTKRNLIMISCFVENNTATGLGGGIYNGGGGQVTLSNCDVFNNRASNGGGIFNAGAAAGATLDIKSH